MCTTMDEKATILKEKSEGKTEASVDDYQGNALLECRELKKSGEVGNFLQTWVEG
jgi:hypothetical protein